VSTSININSLKPIKTWNDFIESIPGITPFSFNPSLYNFYKKHFNWKPYYFLIYDKEELCAVLPLVNTGKAWVSLPHFSYGGLLVSENINIQEYTGIIDSIISKITNNNLPHGFHTFNLDNQEILKNQHSEQVFIRSLNNKEEEGFIGSEKVTSILQLPEDETGLLNMMSSNLSRKVNKAKKSGIITKAGGSELLDDFYKLYSRNIYKLRSLSYRKKFFEDLMETYECGEVKIFISYKEDEVVGAAILAFYNGFYENMFFATSSKSRKDYVSDLLHWEMINYSIKKNNAINIEDKNSSGRNAVYSFGRSTSYSGVHKYKSHWPVKDYPLYNYSNITDVRKNKWFSKIWGLIPYAISKPLGGYLIKHIY